MNKKTKGKTYSKKKKKQERKNRLFYLLILLLMTTLSLSFSSYAWFTTNRLVRVDLLDVNVRAQGGLEISTDGANWKGALTIYDIVDAHNTYPTSVNQIPKTLEPVSTIGELENGKLKMFYGTAEGNLTGDYILSAERSIETESFDEESTGKFITFDLFLKTTNPSQLYLTPLSNITYNGETSVGIENAVRVAFVEEGTMPAGSAIESIQALSTNSRNNVYIWEPNYNTHTIHGIENALNVYGITTSENGDIISYDGISNPISSRLNISASNANSRLYPAYFSPVNVSYYTENNFTTNKPIFTLKSGITKYRIYMWIEGQDVDCENNASVGNIVLNLQFTTNPS